MRNRTRAYVRYSDHKQDDGFSIEYQVAEIEEFAKKNFLDLQHIHTDQALTATQVAGRDQFFALIQAVKNNQVDVVVVWKMNRMFRNSLESHKYRKIFRDHGVKLMSVTQHIDEETSEGRFMTSTIANMDQYQSESISDHVKASMREMARQGYYTGGRVLYGYKLMEIENGGRIRKKYTTNEAEAQIVNKIFDLFVGGYTVIRIMYYLRDNNIKTRYGKFFSEQVILQMLRNDCYIGTVRYKVQHTDEIVTENAHEPIISKGKWLAAQNILNQKKPVAPRRKKYYYALTGKVFCSCGSHCFGTSSTSVRGEKRYVYHSYVCRQKRNFRNCNVPQLSREKLESITLNAIKAQILNPERIEQLVPQLSKYLDDSPSLASESIRELKGRIKEIKAKLDILIEMRLNGEMSGETIRIKSAPLESELEVLQNQVYLYQEQQSQAITPDDIRSFLFDMLAQAENCTDQVLKTIFDCFVERIDISQDEIKVKLRVFSAQQFAYKDMIPTPIISLSATAHR